jgi:hypothetical protein
LLGPSRGVELRLSRQPRPGAPRAPPAPLPPAPPVPSGPGSRRLTDTEETVHHDLAAAIAAKASAVSVDASN